MCPQLDGAGDEEPSPEVRRFRRLGTTGSRWAPSSAVGGAFRPVVVTAVPSEARRPAGDGPSGEDSMGGRKEEDGVRGERAAEVVVIVQRTTEDIAGSGEEGEGSLGIRASADDSAMAEGDDRDSVVVEIMEQSAVEETSETVIVVGSASNSGGLETMTDSSATDRSENSVMAESVFAGSAALKPVGEDVPVSDRTGNGSVLMEEGVLEESTVAGGSCDR